MFVGAGKTKKSFSHDNHSPTRNSKWCCPTPCQKRCLFRYMSSQILFCHIPADNPSSIESLFCGPVELSQFNDSLRAGRYEDRIPIGERFPAPVQTGPGTHPASVQWVPGLCPGGKASEAWHLSLTPIQSRDLRGLLKGKL
jgi:hypothetical protein